MLKRSCQSTASIEASTRRTYAAIAVLFSAAMLTGCAEHARVMTIPPGAKVFIEGREVGTTPYVLTLEREQIRDYPYHLDLQPYRSVDGVMKSGVAPGRVVGAIFTLGILYAFRSPYYVADAKHILALQPDVVWTSQAPVEERLRKLKDLHDEGVLSPAEYQQQRTRILEESAPAPAPAP